jgi:hypothetical protein
MSGAEKIIAGLEDAIAFLKGDTTRGELVSPRPDPMTPRDLVATIHLWMIQEGDETTKRILATALVERWLARRIRAFTTGIMHGDEDHRIWLDEAAKAFIDGQPLPPPRGKGTAPTKPGQSPPVRI